jgi:hypothetical protein
VEGFSSLTRFLQDAINQKRVDWDVIYLVCWHVHVLTNLSHSFLSD